MDSNTICGDQCDPFRWSDRDCLNRYRRCNDPHPVKDAGRRGVRGQSSDSSRMVVDAERVADSAHRVVRVEAVVVGDAVKLVDEGEYFGVVWRRSAHEPYDRPDA